LPLQRNVKKGSVLRFVKIVHLAAWYNSSAVRRFGIWLFISELEKKIQVSQVSVHLIDLTLLVAAECGHWIRIKKAERIRP
jgi:hypothetical protein